MLLRPDIVDVLNCDTFGEFPPGHDTEHLCFHSDEASEIEQDK